jgi:prepilin-type N-terminal cleavage/methylation domain-containing protein
MRRRPGYTLLEVMLVLAIIVILAAVAYPSVEGMYSGVRLRAAVDGLRGALMRARAHAMDETQPYRFAVAPGQGNYRVAPENAGYWGGGASPPPADPNNPPLVLEESLPKGIRFTLNGMGGGDSSAPPGGSDAGGWAQVVTFLPDGSATEDMQIAVQAPGTRPLVLRLRAMTGVVTVQQQGE